ncbi:putative retrotransposon hot spot protein (RHS) [Trypanosoma cruzi]|uniref:Putative retrotransposon hot spot protein (RHS) n=1 Tax=Trypanosoma cruzi TaxID=5693 RepID=A0A2V2UNA1_TRYCR|nr:putative retrotransposon hot spot protein (RHS) [Trypanosoma cruzi]RNC60862.1 retrotransposon hot spot protein (RHS) [Trypanosoma cruzi]
MWRCCGRSHVASLRRRWALTASPTGVAVWLHGAPTVPPCECHAQRHWDCGTKKPRVSFGASGTCWPQLGGASGTLHHTGVVMAPCSSSSVVSDAAARRGVAETRRTNWTIDSWRHKVLLEGKERIRKVRLDGLLCNYIDGGAVVEFYRRPICGGFSISSTKFIHEEVLLSTIKASPPYQEI